MHVLKERAALLIVELIGIAILVPIFEILVELHHLKIKITSQFET